MARPKNKTEYLTLRISPQNKKDIINFCKKINISLTDLTMISLQNFFDEYFIFISLIEPKDYALLLDNIENNMKGFEWG